jgi:uncharacterized protein YyaL (SSP411 family)
MNELKDHANLYLRQHGNNPIFWKAWSDHIWHKAQQENKLVIVSIGYSACHWCHVMEKECFEDNEVAQLTNAHFVSIKVDREERPDIDQSFMNALQLMGKPGGWPLNCICLPNGVPIFGGTYFPKGRWMKILKEIQRLHQTEPDTLLGYAQEISTAILEWDQRNNSAALSLRIDHDTIQSWIADQDMQKGGTQGAPKFPMPPLLNAMLWYGSDYPMARHWALLTLQKMKEGGIYDNVHGGFCRYSVDSEWHIPHFEKMLYDNAQLMSSYALGLLFENRIEFSLAMEGIDKWVGEKMTSEEGLIFSAQDADTDGEEGKYYCYNIEEIKKAGGIHYASLQLLFDFEKYSHWEDNRIVFRQKISLSEWAVMIEKNIDAALDILQNFCAQLSTLSSSRNRPQIDSKILSSWNAMMVVGWTNASYWKEYYLIKAIDLFADMQLHLKTNQKWTQGKYSNGSLPVLLSDTLAHVQNAALHLLMRTGDERYFQEALYCVQALEAFWDEKDQLYFLGNSKDVFIQKKEITDSVTPSVNALICQNLFVLGILSGDQQLIQRSEKMMASVQEFAQHPAYSAQWLQQWIYREHGGIVIAQHATTSEIQTIRSWGIFVFEIKCPSTIPAFQGKDHTQKQFHLCTFASCSTGFSNLLSLQQYFLSLKSASVEGK